MQQRSYVIFSNETTVKILRFLKCGFRHCFIIIGNQNTTTVIDPILFKIDVNIFNSNIDIVRDICIKNNMIAIDVTRYFTDKDIDKKDNRFSFGIFTCVEVIKRILGIKNKFILTPYRLYKFLNENND